MENLNNYTAVGENAEVINSTELTITELTAKIEAEPSNAELYSDRAFWYSLSNNDAQSLEDYSKAIELNPNNASYFSSRSSVYKNMKKNDTALEDINKAIELDFDNHNYFNTRAELYEILGKNDDATADYQKAIELALIKFETHDFSSSMPSDTGWTADQIISGRRGLLLIKISGYYHKIKDYDNALSYIEQAIELCPIKFEKLYKMTEKRADIYFDMQEYEKAAIDYLASNKIDEKALQCLIFTGRIDDIINKSANDEKYLSEAMFSLYSLIAKYDALTNVAKLNQTGSNYIVTKQQMIDLFEKINIIASKSQETLFIISIIHTTLGNLEKALDLLNTTHFDNSNAENNRLISIAKIFSLQNKKYEAENTLSKITEPLTEINLIARAEVYQNLKQYQKALTDFSICKDLADKTILLLALIVDMVEANEITDEEIKKYIQSEKDIATFQAYLYSKSTNFQDNNDYENALRILNTIIVLGVEKSFYYLQQALCYYNLNQFENAIISCTKGIDLDGGGSLYGYRGICYYELKQYELAISDLTKDIDFDSNSMFSFLVRAKLYYEIGQKDECYADLEYCKDNWHLWIQKQEALRDELIQMDENKGKKDYSYMYKISPAYSLAEIARTSDFKFLLRLMELFFDLKNYKFYTDDYAEIADILDNLPKKQKTLPESYRQICIKLFNTKDFSGDENAYLNSSLEMFKLTRKMRLISIITEKITAENYAKEFSQDQYRQILDMFNLFSGISVEISKQVIELNKQHEEEKARAIIKAKDELMQSFSHKMKNSFPKSVANLENLEAELPQAKDEIHSAIKQIQHLEKLAHAINFSFKGNLEDIKYDIENPLNGKSLKTIILAALDNSIANLLDKSGVYSVYSAQYFDLATKKNARAAYAKFSDKNYENLQYFLAEFFLNLTIDFGNAEKYIIGNSRHSLTKFAEIIEELVFNALKYAASAQERYLKISFEQVDKKIILTIENSCNMANNQLKTSGLGRQIVKNTLEALKIDYEYQTDETCYKAVVAIPDWWK